MNALISSALCEAARLLHDDEADAHQSTCGSGSADNKSRAYLIESIFSLLPDLLWVKDLDSRFVVANPAIAHSAGFDTPDELIGKTDFDFHEPEKAGAFFELEQRLMRTGESSIAQEEWYNRREGGTIWLLTSKIPIRDEQGKIIGIAGMSHDVTDRKQSDVLQRGQGQLLEMIAMSAPIDEVLGTLIELIEGQLPGFNGSVLLLNQTGNGFSQCVAPNLPAEWNAMTLTVPIGPSVGSCGTAAWTRKPVMVRDIRESPLWVDFVVAAEPYGFRSCWSTPIISHHGRLMGTFALYSYEPCDPSEKTLRLIDLATHIAGIALERKYTEDRITFLAHHDSLTGLPNRTRLNPHIKGVIDRARNNSSGVLLAYLDVDNFKIVNDSLGHAVGDDLLVIVANRMIGFKDLPMQVFRLGGDEFVLVLEDPSPDCEAAWKMLQDIHKSITRPMSIDEHFLNVTGSVGCTQFPEFGSSAEELLAQADIAMYRAKQMGRDCCQRFTPDMENNSRERLYLRDQLRLALENKGELFLHYQPQVSAADDTIFGVEALVRWNHPVRGLIPPSVFIEIAEGSGMISEIGEWVLREACRQNKAWQDAGLPPLTMSVNVSARQFRDAGFSLTVAAALQDTGLCARYLELELTESMIMQDVNGAVTTMKNLADLGVGLAIDDFGTGFSSLSALKRFPVSRLKIDQSFVRGLPDDESDAAIASAVILMAQKLNMKVIAEGVETQAQADFLKLAGCDEIQGYLISRPVDAGAIVDFVSEHSKLVARVA